MRATYYPGGPQGHEIPASATVGLRPGYIYRVKLTVTGLPSQAHGEVLNLYPTLEVRGSLQLPPKQSVHDYPVTIVLSNDDIEQVLRASALVTKVVALEHPECAYPAASRAEEPFEIRLFPWQNLLEEARTVGRPLLVVRLGEREVSPDEMAHQAVPGTVFLPGAHGLGSPTAPPMLPSACWQLYDPVLGPPDPADECLHDGGDVGAPAGIDAAGRLRGLDPSDTVAEYSTCKGLRKLAISNRVCLCVPRYIVLRSELIPVGAETVLALKDTLAIERQIELLKRVPPLEVEQNQHPVAVRVRARPSAVEQFVGASVVGRVEGLKELVRAEIPYDVTGVCQKIEKVERPLVLCKWLDPPSAKVGDIVTFYLRYSNPGELPIADVVVSDSLTTRLEYVPQTARSDRSAVFTTQNNEAGSVVLRWELSGRLQPGQSGLISFQARVR
jgi:uncharacterized repeat protein (TIGR01451 family)